MGAYVGTGQGAFIQETTFRYVGYGGDFDRPRRDFTCLITTCCLLSLLLLIPLLLWIFWPEPTHDHWCHVAGVQTMSPAQREFCCNTMSIGCEAERAPAGAVQAAWQGLRARRRSSCCRV